MKKINAFYDNSLFTEVEFSETRNLVLSKSLAVEKYMSMYLAEIMDIENHLETKSFGNTSNALSFNQKLHLFTDLKYLDKDERIKFLKFSEIRNQFAHNSDCLNFTNTFNQDILNPLKKYYNILNESSPTEKQYEKAFFLLFEDIKSIFLRIRLEVYNNKASEFLAEYTLKVYDRAIIKNSENFDREILDKLIQEVGKLVWEEYGLSNQTFRTDIRFKHGKYFK